MHCFLKKAVLIILALLKFLFLQKVSLVVFYSVLQTGVVDSLLHTPTKNAFSGFPDVIS